MTSLPVNVVNLICEWAAGDDMERYPFFCPRTHKLSWKINKHSNKFLKKGDIILHNNLHARLVEGLIDICNTKTMEVTRNLAYKAVLFKYINGLFSMYIEFDSETQPDKKDKYICRAMVTFEAYNRGGIMKGETQFIYLNGTHYGLVHGGVFKLEDKKIELFIESF
jgi:hypothetical protein